MHDSKGGTSWHAICCATRCKLHVLGLFYGAPRIVLVCFSVSILASSSEHLFRLLVQENKSVGAELTVFTENNFHNLTAPDPYSLMNTSQSLPQLSTLLSVFLFCLHECSYWYLDMHPCWNRKWHDSKCVYFMFDTLLWSTGKSAVPALTPKLQQSRCLKPHIQIK